ncbi:MAG: hypothetical protein D6732_25135 [Methanobacteriota archaeon]|nr:MAG: hypothetical protein D6732_25135 [Euryarchaeota archaeon]
MTFNAYPPKKSSRGIDHSPKIYFDISYTPFDRTQKSREDHDLILHPKRRHSESKQCSWI